MSHAHDRDQPPASGTNRPPTEKPPAVPDHFSAVASAYAAFRPGYPDSLFDWIAEHGNRAGLVWDCAAGSGQAAIPLADRFAGVIATDVSALQLAHAPPHPRVRCRIAPAESSGLDAGSVDVLTVGQALHWFDLERFWPEVRRVVRPGGLVVAWTYGNHTTGDGPIDKLTEQYTTDIVGPWWPPQRDHILAEYATLSFPFERMTAPKIEMSVSWTVDQALGYIHSWSATAGYMRAHGHDPVDRLAHELRPLWGDGQRVVRWTFTVLAGRLEGQMVDIAPVSSLASGGRPI